MSGDEAAGLYPASDTLRVDEEMFTFADYEGDTITAWIGDDGDLYIRNETSDEGTSVTVLLSDAAANALAEFPKAGVTR